MFAVMSSDHPRCVNRQSLVVGPPYCLALSSYTSRMIRNHESEQQAPTSLITKIGIHFICYNLGRVVVFEYQILSRTGIKSQNFILIISYCSHKSEICFTVLGSSSTGNHGIEKFITSSRNKYRNLLMLN